MPNDLMEKPTTRQRLQLELNIDQKLIKDFYRKERPTYPVVILPKISTCSSTFIQTVHRLVIHGKPFPVYQAVTTNSLSFSSCDLQPCSASIQTNNQND